ELQKRWGKRSLREAVAPAIALAANGFQVGLPFVRALEDRHDCVAADPEASRIFLHKGDDGELEPPEPGDRLIQPDLARTLRNISLRGADAFYRGSMARRIAQAVKAGGGILTEQDL